MSDQHWSQMMLPRERIEQLESVNRELRKENEARRTQLKETEEKGRVLMDMCRDLKARVTELEHLLQSQRRNNQELQRILNQGVTPYPPFILRKQAEAVEREAQLIRSAAQQDGRRKLTMNAVAKVLTDSALKLRQQADEIEKAGGKK